MKKNQTNKSESSASRPKTLKEAFSGFAWHRAGVLVLSTAAAIAFYYFMNIVYYEYTPFVVGAYVIAAGGLILAYFIYNRAFTGRGVTYDMLPDAMSDREKKQYLAEVAERERKSRWMLMVIFPLIITLMIDLVKLFIIDEYFPIHKL